MSASPAPTRTFSAGLAIVFCLWLAELSGGLLCPLPFRCLRNCTLKQRSQQLERPGIEHILFFQPAAPGLTHAIDKVIEVLGAVGIGADGHEHLFVARIQQAARR